MKTTTTLTKTAMALALFAAATFTTAPAHAQSVRGSISYASVRAFLSVQTRIDTCGKTDVATVIEDLQTSEDNINAGSFDTGTMGTDALQWRDDCLAAAAAVTRLRFGPREVTARHIQFEMRAALADDAQAANHLARASAAIEAEDSDTSDAELTSGLAALKAANVHVHNATTLLGRSI